MSRLISLFAVLAIFAAPAAAKEPLPINKTEARNWSETKVRERVMAQLQDIISENRWPDAADGRVSPKRTLTDLDFITKGRATPYKGLCQMDLLTVEFEPVDGEYGDADTPVSASGFRSTRYYGFLSPPEQNANDLEDWDTPLDHRACSRVDYWEDELFLAPDEEDAVDGYLVFLRARDAILAGQPPFPFTCSKWQSDDQRSCEDLFKEIADAQVSSIERCGEPVRAHCYKIDAGEFAVTIRTSGYAIGGDKPPVLTILDVNLSRYLILTHERVD